MKPRAPSSTDATVFIHDYDRPMSIMIVIDGTPSDDAARIGTLLCDDNNNSCGARSPYALPGGSESFMLFIACARKKKWAL